MNDEFQLMIHFSCRTAHGEPGRETGAMSRRFGDVRTTSAFPLIADVRCEDQQVRKVPILLQKSVETSREA